MRREKWLAKKKKNVCIAINLVLILQLDALVGFQKHEFFLQFLLSAN